MKTTTPHDGVYARIGPSRIHGVGVRAIRDIPAGTLMFQGESERVAWVSRATVRRLPKAIRALYEDFGIVSGWPKRTKHPRLVRCPRPATRLLYPFAKLRTRALSGRTSSEHAPG